LRILVVEDEETLAAAIVELLRIEGYAVDLAADGESASELAFVNPYDLVVLDWTIPPPSGLELLRSWREEGKDTPVLMLTGRGGLADRVDGLDTGADDYLTKPFAFAELLARVRSLLRRRERPVADQLTAGDLAMDRTARTVTVAGVDLSLSPKEFALLEYLLTHKDQVVSRSELIEHVWDDDFDSMSNLVDVMVHRLRKKIDGGRETTLLRTVRGAGYSLAGERS
jgi:DNA-binding response OmpR family regulator